jgi:DNA-binding protein H-NS
LKSSRQNNRKAENLSTRENNEYTESEDKMMYDLHQIRHQMAKEGIDLKKLRENTAEVAKKYNLRTVPSPATIPGSVQK